MLTWLLVTLIILTLIATYVFWIRPALKARPSFAEFYAREDSFWAALSAKFPRLVMPAPAKDPTHATALRLIRPDGYVGYAGAARDQSKAEAYLAALAG